MVFKKILTELLFFTIGCTLSLQACEEEEKYQFYILGTSTSQDKKFTPLNKKKTPHSSPICPLLPPPLSTGLIPSVPEENDYLSQSFYSNPLPFYPASTQSLPEAYFSSPPPSLPPFSNNQLDNSFASPPGRIIHPFILAPTAIRPLSNMVEILEKGAFLSEDKKD